ncbi:MAG: peptidoglycan-binding domain-containing protein [Nitrospirota bacterium]
MSWEKIYYHPDNAEFRRMRPNPNVIHAGDRLVIPDPETGWYTGAATQRHTFRRKPANSLLRIVVRDENGEVVANEPYVVRVGDVEYSGVTDGQGLVEQEIPTGAGEALLVLEGWNLTLPLRIGHLDPVDDRDEGSRIISGAQARLNNLGFFCGSVDDKQGPKTTEALRAFQRQVMGRSEPDGVLDQQTRDALMREHGC